ARPIRIGTCDQPQRAAQRDPQNGEDIASVHCFFVLKRIVLKATNSAANSNAGNAFEPPWCAPMVQEQPSPPPPPSPPPLPPPPPPPLPASSVDASATAMSGTGVATVTVLRKVSPKKVTASCTMRAPILYFPSVIGAVILNLNITVDDCGTVAPPGTKMRTSVNGLPI